MPTTIKLIYEKHENDFGFIEEGHPSVGHINQTIVKLNEMSCVHHPLTIYSWGLKKEAAAAAEDCELIFDVSLFFTKVEKSVRSHLSNLNGKDTVIQEGILRHPRFVDLVSTILASVDEKQPKGIAFTCNYGKHRSVGWAEIMRTHFYPLSRLQHLNLT